MQIVFSLLCLSLFAGFSGTVSEDDGSEETKAKLQAIQKQLVELRQQEQRLVKQLKQAKREAAKKHERVEREAAKGQAHYVKVEVRGTLSEERLLAPSLERQTVWVVSAAGASWILDFGDKKEFRELAEQQRSKSVLITGQLVRQYTGRTFNDGKEPVLVITTFKVAGQ